MRAMETAYHLFNKHLNFAKITFMLVPEMREALGSTCDIPRPLEETVAYAKKSFPNIDLSLLQGDLWFIESVEPNWKSVFKRRVTKNAEKSSIAQATLDFMRVEYSRET